MDKKKIIGITGGIGAGKTIVCSILHTMGYPVFYSDKAAKDIILEDQAVRKAITNLFGEEAYLNNSLNKPFLAKKIFSDVSLREAMNEIVHPAVRNAFTTWAEAQSSTLVFNEAAILFETGAYKMYDKNILVTAQEETRVKRVMSRDNITKEAVQQRMKSQWSDEKKTPMADFVIHNDDDKLLIPQVIELINGLKE